MKHDVVLPPYSVIDEPDLAFHPDRQSDRHKHPLQGLVQYGPYSRSLVSKVIDPIRLGLIVPYGTRGVVGNLLTELANPQSPKERRAYLIDYPGFERIYGIRITAGPRETWLQLSADVDSKMQNAEKPHLVLAEHLTKAISSMQANRASFDVLLVYLPNSWEKYFGGGSDDDFDLHDLLKATTATLGIPTQIVRESHALNYFCRASVMWRLSIAFYCKAGGVPWKIAATNPDTAFIGLSYAMRPLAANSPRFVTCCSQVFDADGAGLEFLTYDTADVFLERDNPFLTRKEMRKVMARSLALYQRRHAGRTPRRIAVHKSTEFKQDEVNGCFDAFNAIEEIDLVHVQNSTPWRGVLIEAPQQKGSQKGEPGGYPCYRGSYVTLGGREALLWTQGNAPTAVTGQNFYKEGKGIPSPLFLKRYAGHGSWEEGSREVLGLTKMDWNNDSLYNRLPVTLSYASKLARTIKRMPSLSSRPYELRFFM